MYLLNCNLYYTRQNLKTQNILDLRKIPALAELVSDELKLILSDGKVSVDTLTAEKSVLVGRNSSDGAEILHKSSVLLI